MIDVADPIVHRRHSQARKSQARFHLDAKGIDVPQLSV
jgi:hypothetical protein